MHADAPVAADALSGGGKRKPQAQRAEKAAGDEDMTLQDAQSQPQGLWEQMVLEEHKQAASMAGMRVGDWEAQQQLQMALLASRDGVAAAEQKSWEQQRAAALEEKAEEWSTQQEAVEEKQHEQEEEVEDDEEEEEVAELLTAAAAYADNPNAPPERAVMQFELPVEVVHRVFAYLDPDSIGYAAMVSPTWSIRPDDSVYRMLCERVYPAQTKKKLLRIERWPSWKHMFLHRPRVRTNGMYALRTWYMKAPHLDMWSQLAPGTVLEVVYYRYFKFYDDGTVLYSLNHTPPDQMMRLFSTIEFEGEQPITIPDQQPVATATSTASATHSQASAHHRQAGGRQPRQNQPVAGSSGARAVGTTSGSQIFVGRYVISQRVLTVTVHTHYAQIGFELELVHGLSGHFSVLRLMSHTSTSLSDPRSQPIPHQVPSDLFYFKRDWELNRAIAREKRGGFR